MHAAACILRFVVPVEMIQIGFSHTVFPRHFEPGIRRENGIFPLVVHAGRFDPLPLAFAGPYVAANHIAVPSVSLRCSEPSVRPMHTLHQSCPGSDPGCNRHRGSIDRPATNLSRKRGAPVLL